MGNKDNWQTPKIAVDYLRPYIPEKVHVVWEPACGELRIVKALVKYGYKVIATDIDAGQDYFQKYPLVDFDVIITNPPYSLTDKWLERSFFIGKPFAL
jgi:hypothetical protein